MSFHIRFLKSIFAAVILSAPAGLGVNVSYFIQRAVKRRRLFVSYLGMIISYAAVLICVFLLGEFSLKKMILKTDIYWYFIALAAAQAAMLLEYVMGAAAMTVYTGRRVSGIKVHFVYSDHERISAVDIAAVAAFVILEEMIFRAALFEVFKKEELSLPFAIAAGAAVFALNHIHFGRLVAAQKLISGAVFSAIYVLSGYCIVIPVLAHMAQNMTLLWLGRRESPAAAGKAR